MNKRDLRKKAQKSVNKFIRTMNKSIEEDNLWRGRFVAKQTSSQWFKFDDNSGGVLRVYVEFRDKKTNRTREYIFENYGIHRIFWSMNKFITEDCFEDTWKDKDALYSDTTDYTRLP